MVAIINTREDLDALRGTPAYEQALRDIIGACTIRMDLARYPDGYGMPDYKGPEIKPKWKDVPDQRVLDRLEISIDEVQAELDRIGDGASGGEATL